MCVETILCASLAGATPAMTHDIPITFALPAVARRKFTAAFDGGLLSSDTGVLQLSFAERHC